MSIFTRHPHPPPNPTFLASAHFVDEKGAPYVGYSASLWVDTQGILFTTTDVQGRASWWITNQYEGWGAQLSMSKEVDSPQLFTERIPTNRDTQKAPYGLGVHAVPLPPPIPAPKSRDEILSVTMMFQGLTVQTQQFGALPWFEAALPWMTKADRESAYAAKKAAGDTHSMAGAPTGGALYPEPGQPYDQPGFGPLDWTNGLTKMTPDFLALIVEQIQHGFTPIVFFDERQDVSRKCLELAMDAYLTNEYGVDFTQYVITVPGFDGVFYGWNPPDLIVEWAAYARSRSPNCYLGLEHNTGHIPLGEGGSDYAPGGKMNGFDLILSEYDDWNPNVPGSAGDGVWQINGRLERPYNRPPDQPQGDDPNPPFYLAQPSPRGPYYHLAFEFNEFLWVRSRVSAEDIQKQRDYLKAMGCRWTG